MYATAGVAVNVQNINCAAGLPINSAAKKLRFSGIPEPALGNSLCFAYADTNSEQHKIQMSPRAPFIVAELNVKGEIQLQERYAYDQLQKIPGAMELTATFAARLYATPEEFEVDLPLSKSSLHLRWKSSAASAGIATLRSDGELASLSLLAAGLDAEADHITLDTFQRHLLRELRDTGYEPAFGLMDLKERPLIATINFKSPSSPTDQLLTALADRCFAAAYFRMLGLA
jgi:hypothetical protein